MPGRGRGGQQYTNIPTVQDALGEVVQLLAQAKLLPDAQGYMPLLQALEQGVLQMIDAMRKQTAHQAAQGPQQPQDRQPGGGMGGMGGGGPGGGGGGMSDMGPQPGGAQIAPGGGAGMAGFGTPNPDELRRTLAGPAAVGAMS
jgi:hypothetical protein